MHIGLKIKVVRLSKGLSQQDLADKINKTRALVSHIEQTGKVNSYTLNKICNVLNTDIANLEYVVNDGNDLNLQKKNISLMEREIQMLKDEIKFLKELVQNQKEIIKTLKGTMPLRRK